MYGCFSPCIVSRHLDCDVCVHICTRHPNFVTSICPLLPKGMFAIRDEREYVIQEDFMKAVRKISDNKKLETKLDYKPV